MKGMTNEILKSAWIVRWGFYGSDEDIQLLKYGIKEKIADFYNGRKDFDKVIISHAKNLYKEKMLWPSEKLYLEHYKSSNKRMDEFFGKKIPVFTHYQSKEYNDLVSCYNKNGPAHADCRALREKYIPEYIIVGHNPHVEIKRVFNLFVKDLDGTETIFWDEPLANGEVKHESYTKV